MAVADPSRRLILETLRSGEATAGELAELVPVARPGASRHLRVLRDVGLVNVRPEGQRRIYSLRDEPLVRVDEWLAPFRQVWQDRFAALHAEVARGKRGGAGRGRGVAP